MNNWPAIIILLTTFFKNDESKVAMWLDSKNPLLGLQRPIEMIKIGRSKKLLKFMEVQLFKGSRD